jgi:hypothetical protein
MATWIFFALDFGQNPISNLYSSEIKILSISEGEKCIDL